LGQSAVLSSDLDRPPLMEPISWSVRRRCPRWLRNARDSVRSLWPRDDRSRGHLAQSDTFRHVQKDANDSYCGLRLCTLAPGLRTCNATRFLHNPPLAPPQCIFPPLYCLAHITRPDRLMLCKQGSPPSGHAISTQIEQHDPRL
jgi:hypothetical protein